MNLLYPIFLKVSILEILIVGGGLVALEKLKFLFKNSPNAQVTLLSPKICKEIQLLLKKYKIKIINDFYHVKYLNKKNLVIITTNNTKINIQIYRDCKNFCLLVNVADQPDLCDFYMGSIVTKGNLKIGISTNGKSPTMAKRFREILEEILPEKIDDLLIEINKYRNKLKVSFEKKLKILNKITQ